MTSDPGIGIDAAKVVSECIHSSRVKEMGVYLLKRNNNVEEEDEDIMQSYDRLSDEEVKKYQLKLARSLVVFMELLHLLISRNRDLLLDVIQSRKKNEAGSTSQSTGKHLRDTSLGSFATFGKPVKGEASLQGTLGTSGDRSRHGQELQRRGSSANDSTNSSQDGKSTREESSTAAHSRRSTSDDYNGSSTFGSMKDAVIERVRTDSAIGIQRELQLAFISLAKDLYPMIFGIMESETPRWLKQCAQDNYFSAYTYRQTKIRTYRLFIGFIKFLFLLMNCNCELNIHSFLSSLCVAIGEELTFEDVNISGIGTDDGFTVGDGKYAHVMRHTSHPSGGGLGLIPSLSRSDTRSHHTSSAPGSPVSPGESIGSGSAHSRGSIDGRSGRSRSSKEIRAESRASC
jgi:hypothetical protein